MKKRIPILTTCLIAAGLLAGAAFLSVEQKIIAAEPPTDQAHAAHVAAAASQAGGQTVEARLTEILARLERLEAITQQQSVHRQPGESSPSGAMPMDTGNPPRMRPMPGMGSGPKSMQGGMPGMNTTAGGKGGMENGPALADQLAELRSKLRRLEAKLQQESGSVSGAMPMGGKPGMGSGTKPMQGGMPGMSGMGAPGATKPAGGMSGMGGGASPPGGEMGMMGMKMDKMMGMMDKMMGGMGGGAKPAAGAPMAGGGMPMMDDDMMEMAPMGGGAMPPAAPMAGGGMAMMDDDKIEMAGMMGMMGGMAGKGSSGVAMPSALPGFPGASHLYHLGATGFFLDHRQHIALSTEQKMMLNQIKEQAALAKASTGRSVQEAEQELWTLTAADQPDNDQIEAKVAEIEKLKGDARLGFISAVGDAAKILNEGQRMSLTGFAPPASAPPAAAAPAPMAAMKDM